MSQDSSSLLVPVYKQIGKTPLECVEEYKSKHRLDPSIIVSYAGRLDPMAEGVLLLLVGEANKKRREYEHLNKEYEVTVLVGFATDTGDLMGKLIMNNDQLRITNERKQLEKVLPSFVGLVEQKYPIYSSAKVRGKPLFWWARQGRLNEIEIPSHKVQIDNVELISEGTITEEAILEYIVGSVGSVQGDFRQEEIITKWQEVLGMSIPSLRERNEVTDEAISSSREIAASSLYHAPPRNDKKSDLQHLNRIFTLRITCGSGTYMRQLVADIGEKLGIPLCAFKIKRISVGKYAIGDCARHEIASSLDNSSQ